MPQLAIGAGWGLATLADTKWIRTWVPHAVGAAATALMVVRQLPLYQVPAEAWAYMKYGAFLTLEETVGRELGALLAPGETFYEWGAEPGLYFVSRHSPPSGAFYVFPVLEGPAAGPLAARAVADLERRPPAVFVINQARRGPHARARGESVLQGHPILDWAGPRYVPMAGSADRGLFMIFVGRGGHLDVAHAR